MTHSWHHLKPQFYKAFAFALLTLGCFSILVAQDTAGITSALKTNLLLSEQLGMLGPVAISPYWGLFLASAASLFGGVENEFLVTHPFMGNWIVFLLFGLSAVLTSVPNITKYSKALGVASSYLEDHVSIVIVVLAITLPILHNAVGTPPAHGEFGILDMSLYSLVMMAFSAFYMFVVTTVRLFFELIAFITPVPLIDTAVEVAKKVSSLILMGVYFISPEVALGISLLLLIIAFFLFKKANRTMNYFKQIYITPILSWIIRRKRDLVDTGIVNRIKGLEKGINATIPVWPIHDYGSIKKQRKTWLIEEAEGDLYLYQLHSFRRFSQQSIDKSTLEAGVNIRQEFNYLTLSGKDKNGGNDLELRINREYFIHKKEMIRICELTGGTNDNIVLEGNESWWKKIKKYFSSKQVAVDTEIG